MPAILCVRSSFTSSFTFICSSFSCFSCSGRSFFFLSFVRFEAIKTKIKNGNILTTVKRNLLSAKISIFLLNFLLHEKILSTHYSFLPESFCGQCPPGYKFIGDLYLQGYQSAFSSTEHACVC